MRPDGGLTTARTNAGVALSPELATGIFDEFTHLDARLPVR